MATFRLGPGNDTRTGTSGADSFFGGAGNDTLRGGNGNDRIFGELGNDRIFGDAGNDTMNGGDGTDQVFGGIGADTIGGGLGSDRLDMGVDSSRDVATFVVDTTTNAGRDTLFNYNDANDFINFGRFGTDADFDTNGDNVINGLDDFTTVRNGRITLDVGAAFGVDNFGAQTLTVLGNVTEFTYDDLIFV